MQRSDLMKIGAGVPLVAAFALATPLAVRAQVTTGTVRGIVRDDAGKAIKGANVTLTPAAGDALKTVTDKDGAYVFLGVQPGTYTLNASVETFSVEKQTITVVQDQVNTTDIAATKAVIAGSSTVRVRATAVRKQVSVQTNVSERTEQLVKSQPNALYQFPGLVFGQPGVTFDTGGYVHLRGGDYNQVGFQVDGIPIIDPIYNGFATNIVTVGLKSASVVTSGADASFSGAGSGFINQVTKDGRDMGGHGLFEYTAGPGNGWGYNGTKIEYGGATKSGKFDYLFSTIQFANKFPDNTQITKVNPSSDQLVKFNYYANASNQFTVYLNNGREKYTNFQDPKTGANAYLRFDPKTGKLTTSNSVLNSIADQRYDLNYVNFKHNFNTASVLNLKVYNLFNRSDNHEENTSAPRYLYPGNRQTGTNLDYSNQITPNYVLRAGAHFVDAKISWRQVNGLPASGTQVDANGFSTISARGLTDRSIENKPKTTTLYLANQFRALQDKVIVDIGANYNTRKYNLVAPNLVDPTGRALNDPTAAASANNLAIPAAYRDRYFYGKGYSSSYTDPRLGVTYSPDNSIIFRTSYGINSQFPDGRRVEVYPSALTGAAATATNVRQQEVRLLRNLAPFNPLKPSRTYDFNIGVEKGFAIPTSLVNGSYSASLNLFRRRMTNQIVYNLPDYSTYGTATAYPVTYDSKGRGHAAGADFVITKRLIRKTDWNGFASYTNITARAQTEYNNGYIPYYVTNLSGFPGLTDADYRGLVQNEVATQYDQKHTVGVVVNKRVFKFFDTSVILDAGSGYPYAGGVGGSDAQHSSFSQGDASFNQVPIVVNGNTLQPNNPIAGRTGWHYKFSWNSNFRVNEDSSFFLNIDNVFTRKTAIVKATSTLSGATFYNGPSAAFPQGQIYYGAQSVTTPRFISFGVRTKF